MKYRNFIQDLADAAGVHPLAVKDVLKAFPKILMRLEEDERLETPLGVFRLTRRLPYFVFLPGTRTKMRIPPALLIKYRTHSRMRRELD